MFFFPKSDPLRADVADPDVPGPRAKRVVEFGERK